jgi:hypothetical protein
MSCLSDMNVGKQLIICMAQNIPKWTIRANFSLIQADIPAYFCIENYNQIPLRKSSVVL